MAANSFASLTCCNPETGKRQQHRVVLTKSGRLSTQCQINRCQRFKEEWRNHFRFSHLVPSSNRIPRNFQHLFHAGLTRNNARYRGKNTTSDWEHKYWRAETDIGNVNLNNRTAKNAELCRTRGDTRLSWATSGKKERLQALYSRRYPELGILSDGSIKILREVEDYLGAERFMAHAASRIPNGRFRLPTSWLKKVRRELDRRSDEDASGITITDVWLHPGVSLQIRFEMDTGWRRNWDQTRTSVCLAVHWKMDKRGGPIEKLKPTSFNANLMMPLTPFSRGEK